MIYGERMPHTFEEAAAKFVDESSHKSLYSDISILKTLMPWIGQLRVDQVHDATLMPYVKSLRQKGRSAGTVKRHLSVVRMVLTRCARKWRDESGNTWLSETPLLEIPEYGKPRSAFPLSWAQQRALLRELPNYLAEASLYAVNTGLRSTAQRSLRWEWEHTVNGLDGSVFVIPAEYMKGRSGKTVDFVVVHNRISQRVIENQRGKHPEFVFTHPSKTGHLPFSYLLTTAFKKARVRAGLKDFRWHDWRHTFGRRLRANRVPKETRKILLAHSSPDITTHYSAAEIEELVAAVRLLEKQTGGTLLKAVRDVR